MSALGPYPYELENHGYTLENFISNKSGSNEGSPSTASNTAPGFWGMHTVIIVTGAAIFDAIANKVRSAFDGCLGSCRVSTRAIGRAAVVLTVCLVAAAILMFPPAAPLAGLLLGYKIVILGGLGVGTIGTPLWYAGRQSETGQSRLTALLSQFHTPQEIREFTLKFTLKLKTAYDTLGSLNARKTDLVFPLLHKIGRSSAPTSQKKRVEDTFIVISKCFEMVRKCGVDTVSKFLKQNNKEAFQVSGPTDTDSTASVSEGSSTDSTASVSEGSSTDSTASVSEGPSVIIIGT